MLVARFLSNAIAFAAAVTVCTSFACSGSGVADDSSTAVPSADTRAPAVQREHIESHVEAGQAFWVVDSGANVEALAQISVGAVVVRVLEREDLTDPNSLPEIADRPIHDTEGNLVDRFADNGGGDGSGPRKDPALADPAGGPPSMSRYRVAVIEDLGGSDSPIEGELWILQSGGVEGGIAYELEGDPVLEVGATYVTFLQEDGVGLWSTPWGRFTLDSSGAIVAVTDEWAQLGVVKQLQGQSVQDLRTLLESVSFGGG